MPVHIPTYREVDDDIRGRIRGASTNEGLVLHALGEVGTPATTDEIADAVTISSDATAGALYRLRCKELVVREGDTHEFAGEDARLLSDALIVADDRLA